MEKYKEIERSIIKKYRKEIWSRFVKAVIEYKLIEEGDPESSYAHFCLHRFHWTPSFFEALDDNEKAFVMASIDIVAGQEEKERRKAQKGR